MSHQKIWNFDNELNFIFDPNLVEFITDEALLKLIDLINQEWSEDFFDDTGFTYDSDLAEFADELLRQKDKMAADQLFAALYGVNGSADLSYARGSVVATTRGSVTVAGGVAVLDGGSIDYSGANNTSSQVGTIYIEITPGYNGNPSKIQVYAWESLAQGSVVNQLSLYHSTNGTMYLWARDSSGTTIFQASLGSYSATLGVKVKWKINFDFTNGNTQVYKDNVAFGQNFSQTFTRTTIGLIRVGDSQTPTNDGLFTVDNFVRYSQIQAGAADPTFPAYRYLENYATLPQFSYSGLGVIQAITNFVATEVGNPRYLLDAKYWNGASWVASNGTYAQSNSAADVLAYLPYFTPAESTLTVYVVFPNSNTLSSIDQLTVTYSGQEYSQDGPNVEPTEGQLTDGIDSILEDVTEPAGTSVRYIVKRGSEYLYWDDEAWVTSDKSPAQTNPLSEIVAQKEELCLCEQPEIIKIIPVLISDGTDTPKVKQIILNYNYFKKLVVPEQCKISGYLLALDGIGVPDGTPIRFWAKKPFEVGANALFILDKVAYTETREGQKGWFETNVVVTELIEKTVNATVGPWTDSQGEEQSKTYKNLIIPDVHEKDFNELIQA